MGALRQRIDECLPAQPQLRDAMQLVMAGNSSPSIQYTPLRNGVIARFVSRITLAGPDVWIAWIATPRFLPHDGDE